MNEITMAFFCKLLIKKWNSPRLFVFLSPNNCNEFMTKLSVNINKLATLRNARGGNVPNLLVAASDIERFGAEGITIHPRPDERHIRYQDARDLKNVVTTEYNIEGNPNEKFIALVLAVKPTQVTLVPDGVDAITSNAGWDAITHADFLKKTIATFKAAGIRTSIFIDPVVAQIEAAAATGTDRIELYTEAYAVGYAAGKKETAIAPYKAAATKAKSLGLGVNAGHDLSLDNIAFFKAEIQELDEVSIGHALICESLYMGLENVIPMYLKALY
jgi:pyridoxine 5-phosphate synthase